MKMITTVILKDTWMRAGHYENRKDSVDIMIRSSREIIDDLIGYGVDFERDDDGVRVLQEKVPIPHRESSSMKILLEKRLQASCLHR